MVHPLVETIGEEVRWRWDGFLPRSYLFSVERLEPQPIGLRQIGLPSGHLFVSPDYQCHVESDGPAFVALIGHCMELGAPNSTDADIVRSLLRRATQDGIDGMLAGTNLLFGRYAAICHVAGTWRAFGDACATRTIFFADDRPAIASHSTLLGDLTGAKPRMDMFRHYWCALPGNASAVEGVRILPANFVLDLATRKMQRFWPRSQRIERPVSDVIDELDLLLGQSAQAVAARWKPALSLTAGLDSRLSLALMRADPDLIIFTYYRDAQDTVDVEVAHLLCDRLGIEHRRLVPVERAQAEQAYRVIDSIHDSTFDRKVAAIYLSGFPQGDDSIVHVRSSLAEIGRAFWRYHPGMPTRLDPDNWVHVSLSKFTASLPGRAEAASYMTQEMRRFFVDAGYDSADPQSPEIMGYDVWDLIYMEHRMSAWHGPALSASDIAFDTSVLFNCRRLLDLLLSVPLPERRHATLARKIIERRCPQIAGIPINPRPRRSLNAIAAAAYRQLKRRATLLRAIETRFRLKSP